MDGLEQTLTTVAQRIREGRSDGRWDNETRVRKSLVDPILRELDWDVEDPEECELEYSVGKGRDKGRVDYALLDSGKLQVFVEAKGIGRIDVRGEEQLFRYGYYGGVQFLVLTDGNQWDFYLNIPQGSPEERRFCRLFLEDLDRIKDHARSLESYLRKDRILSREARKGAEEQYKLKALKEILKHPNEELCNLLAKQVESKSGIRLKTSDVEEYLKRVIVSEVSRTLEPRQADPPLSRAAAEPAKTRLKIVGFILDGEEVRTRSSIDTLAEVLKKFHDTVPGFMERYASETKTNKRNRVARNRADLFPGQPRLVEQYSRDLGNGWWLNDDVPSGVAGIKKLIETACDVAGVPMSDRFRLIEE